MTNPLFRLQTRGNQHSQELGAKVRARQTMAIAYQTQVLRLPTIPSPIPWRLRDQVDSSDLQHKISIRTPRFSCRLHRAMPINRQRKSRSLTRHLGIIPLRRLPRISHLDFLPPLRTIRSRQVTHLPVSSSPKAICQRQVRSPAATAKTTKTLLAGRGSRPHPHMTTQNPKHKRMRWV